MSALEAGRPPLMPGHVLAVKPTPGARRALDSKPVKARDKDTSARRGVSGEDPEGHKRRNPLRRLGRFVLEAAIIVFAALLISTLIKTFGVQQYIVPTGSMEQTLQRGDRIVVSKFGDYRRGDIIVFEDKLAWLAPSTKEPQWYESALQFVGVLPASDSRFLVKRLVGLPGDRVACCTNSQITVNGEPLVEPYLYPGAAPSDVRFDVIVPQDRVFVLGDHRNNSADSRFHLCSDGQRTPSMAFPAVQDIEGPVIAIAWPIRRWESFHTPETYSSVPAQEAPPDEPVVSVYPSC
jgi:signal peptidase I